METKSATIQTTPSFFDPLRPFVFATISSCAATSVIQPIDTLKVRLQILSESKGAGQVVETGVFRTLKGIIAQEGVKGLYRGLDSALLRQATYGTIRIGAYRALCEWQQGDLCNNGSLSFGKKLFYSLFSGSIGSFFGNPFDVVLVRFQSDQTLPVDQRRNYKGVADAFARMYREEGLLSFWKGFYISLLRAATMTGGMLSINDEVKERIVNLRGIKKPDTAANLSAAAVSGVACSFASLPFDNVKTKLQKMKAGSDGKMPYAGIVDCFRKSFAREGITGFWAGYPTFYMRVAPHAMIVLILDNFLNTSYKKWSERIH